MYNSTIFEVKPNDNLYNYFVDITTKYKNLCNTTNFYIRNVMTGIKKSPELRQHNEIEVLHNVFINISGINSIKSKTLKRKIAKIKSNTSLDLKQKEEQINKLLSKSKDTPYPTMDKWFLSYETIEGIFKLTNNESYRELPSHVNQHAIKEVIASWNSFFKATKDYYINPSKYTGKPKLPKYKKCYFCTATFTNVVCTLKEIDGKTYLRFPKTSEMLYLGTYIKANDDLALVKVVPFNNNFKVILTFGSKEPTLTEEELKQLEEDKYKNAKRIFAIDLGLNNFATISNNIGISPIIIKGGFIKSKNQYFNKRRAKLLSKIQKGKNSKESVKTTKRLDSLSRNRDNFLRDCFYKMAHAIVEEALTNDIDTMVIGHTKFWKQEVNIGKANNQNFVSIPYNRFINILKYVAESNDINVLEIEESFTSKASFLDMDEIPTYKKNDTITYTFSGKRTHRGIYKSKEGILINADVNGASNILRKEFPNAFNNIKDLSYLYKSVKVINFKDLYKSRSKKSA